MAADVVRPTIHPHDDSELIKSLELENYRGYLSRQKVQFAYPKLLPGSGLTIICGANNSGKSSIFQALTKFHEVYTSGHLSSPWPRLDREEKHTTGESFLRLTAYDNYEWAQRHDKSHLNPLNAPSTSIAQYYAFISADTGWNEEGERVVSPNEHEQYDGLLTNNSGSLYYRDIFDNNFGNFLIAIRDDSRRKRKMDQFLKRVIPNFHEWRVQARGSNKWRVVVKSYNKQVHGSNLLGSGMLRLFRIGAALYAPKYPNNIVIDEPELHLHPRAQKNLMAVLAEHAKTNQVILITHSPYFVRWQDIENGAKIVHTHWNESTKENEVVNIDINSPEIQHVLTIKNGDWTKPYVIDTVTNELFFTNKILITEGQEDVALLRKYALESDIELDFDFFGYGAGTASNITKLVGLSLKLGVKTCALFDGDRPTDYEAATNAYGKLAMIEILNKPDIRDKKGNGKEGYFTGRGEIKSAEDAKYISALLAKFNRF